MLYIIQDLGYLYPKETSKQKTHYCIFMCHCGNQFKSPLSNVKNGITLSCGCYAKKVSSSTHKKHGFRNHKLYYCWSDMKKRCYKEKNIAYSNYGGRGIIVCERWHSIANFIEDMHPTYQEGLTLDRIDVNGNYEPSNCRWATKETQAQNTRKIRSNNTSGYRGAIFVKRENKWISQIKVNKITTIIGRYDSALKAGIAYDSYVIENNLEHTINGIIL